LSDIWGLLQESLAQYVFQDSISLMRADTEPMNNKNNKIIVLASFLEFAILAGLYMLMALLNIDLYTFNVYCSVEGQGKKK